MMLVGLSMAKEFESLSKQQTYFLDLVWVLH